MDNAHSIEQLQQPENFLLRMNDVILVSLLLILNWFHMWFCFFYCDFEQVNVGLGFFENLIRIKPSVFWIPFRPCLHYTV